MKNKTKTIILLILLILLIASIALNVNLYKQLNAVNADYINLIICVQEELL